jgi:TPR repeat protein
MDKWQAEHYYKLVADQGHPIAQAHSRVVRKEIRYMGASHV